VDMLLERLHDLSVWGYTVKIIRRGKVFQAMVVDQTSGHLMEDAEGFELEGLTQSLAEKYGPNLQVVRE
jgi:hypothetical protein